MICVSPIHLAVYRNGEYASFIIITVYHFRDVIFIRTVTLYNWVKTIWQNSVWSECENEETANTVETEAPNSDDKTKTV